MNRMMRRGMAAVAGILMAGTMLAAVQACTIDGKATAVANGQRAIITREKLTMAVLHTWAPFTFPSRYRAHASIALTEDRTQLDRALPGEATHHAWRWDFGDGSHATGWSVTHRYTRPGAYRISVAAYYPTWKQYYSFDTIRISVT